MCWPWPLQSRRHLWEPLRVRAWLGWPQVRAVRHWVRRSVVAGRQAVPACAGRMQEHMPKALGARDVCVLPQWCHGPCCAAGAHGLPPVLDHDGDCCSAGWLDGVPCHAAAATLVGETANACGVGHALERVSCLCLCGLAHDSTVCTPQTASPATFTKLLWRRLWRLRWPLVTGLKWTVLLCAHSRSCSLLSCPRS